MGVEGRLGLTVDRKQEQGKEGDSDKPQPSVTLFFHLGTPLEASRTNQNSTTSWRPSIQNMSLGMVAHACL